MQLGGQVFLLAWAMDVFMSCSLSFACNWLHGLTVLGVCALHRGVKKPKLVLLYVRIYVYIMLLFYVYLNSAADSAAKDALDGDISDKLNPFSAP